jgi:hypothetical protein
VAIMFEWIIIIIFLFAVIGSIAGWMNTRIILEELDRIKKHMGIQEKKSSFLEAVDKYTKDKNEDE